VGPKLTRKRIVSFREKRNVELTEKKSRKGTGGGGNQEISEKKTLSLKGKEGKSTNFKDKELIASDTEQNLTSELRLL